MQECSGHCNAFSVLSQVKAIKKASVKDTSLIKNEIEIHTSAEHPNIAKLYEIFEDSECFYLILELCAGGPARRGKVS